jgi:PadR family transcriptional regulator PadR
MAESELNVFRSSLDLVILKALSWGPRHGYGVAEWIDQATDAIVLVEEGTLYPALHRLERRGWVGTEWGVSENNRRAKFYRLTPAGRAQLRREMPTWLRHAEAIARALRAATPELA